MAVPTGIASKKPVATQACVALSSACTVTVVAVTAVTFR
jgi:hypothetical protein